MVIGLVDIDGHASKKKWGATIYPNIALGKIARYHKERGDEVEWTFPLKHYDMVYISKVFNFSPDDLTAYDADIIVRGGTGYDITSQLPEEIDRLQPDYSIYPTVGKDKAFGFLTRGCPNKCKWCVVPRKEGKVRPYMDIDEIAIEGRHNIVLMDNNILASGEYAHEQLDKIAMRGYRVDFNQALDARLVTDEFAKQLASIKWIDRRIRFGCDTHGQISECERAIDLIRSHGYRGEFFLYTMLNGDLQECYDRVMYWWRVNQRQRENHEPNVYIHAQPYRDPDGKNAIPQWQKDMARWANLKAIFTSCPFVEFSPRKGFICNQYLKQ